MAARVGTGPCTPCTVGKRIARGYVGISCAAYPGLGGGVEFGMWFARTSFADWAWELSLNAQDLAADFNGIRSGEGGTWMNARVGIKSRLMPCKTWHPTLRGGLSWAIDSSDSRHDLEIGDLTGDDGCLDYFGGYLGLGWEWDIFGGCVTTGPEIWAWAGYSESGSDWAWTATIAWHVLFNF